MKHITQQSVFVLLFLSSFLLPLSLSSQSLAYQNPAPRKADVEQIIKISEAQICNLNWLQSPEWGAFKEKLQSPEVLQLDVPAFRQKFRALARSLPFTHYALSLVHQPNSSSPSPQKPEAFTLTSLENKTALLHIRSFIADGPAMRSICQQIQAGDYQNLIIDLRNNGGGSLDAAVVLGRYLTQLPIDAGYYLSRQWYETHPDSPSPSEVDAFPYLQDMTLQGFMDMLDQNPGFRMVLPAHQEPIFEGPVFILTDHNTASTCEAFVAVLQELKRGVLVGSPTAGAMLSGNFFPVSDELRLFLPVADYFTAHRKRIDKVGIQPDYPVEASQALEYVLQKLLP